VQTPQPKTTSRRKLNPKRKSCYSSRQQQAAALAQKQSVNYARLSDITMDKM